MSMCVCVVAQGRYGESGVRADVLPPGIAALAGTQGTVGYNILYYTTSHHSLISRQYLLMDLYTHCAVGTICVLSLTIHSVRSIPAPLYRLDCPC